MLNKMFNKIFGSKKKEESFISGTFITIQLNEKIMPIDRGILYEDPLDEFLRANAYGEVTGGGTMQAQSGEIEFCDIEVLIYDGNDVEKIAGEIVSKLETVGVPKGSRITIQNTEEDIMFGRKEGLAIYLDGVTLPEHIYKECDLNFVLSELSKLTGYYGKVQRYWQGEKETALYFYGGSFVEMNAAILGFVNDYPLCKGARITQIA